MWDTFFLYPANFLIEYLRKNKSIGVIPIHFSTLGYFFHFVFVKLCNIYLIKCKEEKMKKKFLGFNRTEQGAKRNSIFLCNGWITFIIRLTSEKEIIFSFRITVILFILLSIYGDNQKSKDVFFRSFLVVYLATDGCTI